MTDHTDDAAVLAAKQSLQPAMERQVGDFECTLCGLEQRVDGNCPNDGLPLRRVPKSEH